ncbi:MAG: SH3 domain-containing protein [Alphaproteobacteria bacterium]
MTGIRRFGVLACLVFAAALLASRPQARAADAEQGESGLPVPRFVSLRADEVNLRAGPGVRYPVEWVYQRKLMPVEVVEEFETWRKIRDWQGAEGWVNKAMLSGRRSVLVVGEIRTLRRDPAAESPAIARAEPGVIARLLKCNGNWCKIEAGGYEGWLARADFWGVRADERVE